MSDQISPDCIEALRRLFFERLAENNSQLLVLFSEAERYIGEHKHNSILAVLAEAENRIQDMRTLVIALRQCLEG